MSNDNLSSSEIEQKLHKIFSNILGREISKIESIRRENESKWDSLKHIELVFAVEDAFSVQFNAEEIPYLNSQKEFVVAIEKLL